MCRRAAKRMAMAKRRFCASSRLWYSGFSESAKRRSAAARAANASARSRSRSVASTGCPAVPRAARRAARSLLMSRSACSTAGQFFSCSGVSLSAVLSAAMRASVNAEPGRHHGKNSVVAVAAIHPFDLRAVLGKNIARNVHLLAIDAVEVTLAVEITDAHFVSVGQSVLPTEHDEELLPDDRKTMKPLVDLAGAARNGDLP